MTLNFSFQKHPYQLRKSYAHDCERLRKSYSLSFKIETNNQKSQVVTYLLKSQYEF